MRGYIHNTIPEEEHVRVFRFVGAWLFLRAGFDACYDGHLLVRQVRPDSHRVCAVG